MMKRLLLALVLCFIPLAAYAQQGGGVVVKPPITPTHCAEWFALNILEDSGGVCGGGGGTPGGSNTQLQYNNSGSFGGISGATTNGTAVTYGSSDLILSGSSSGSSTLNAPATGGGTLTLPPGSVGIVAGPSSAVSGHIATFSGTSGQIIQDGGAPGTGTVTSVGCGTGLLCSTSPITTTGTITPTIVQNAQTGTSYATLATDANKVVSLSNTSAQAVSLSQATTTGFTAGFGTEYDEINTGIATITAATSVFDNGLTTLALAQGQDAFVWSDGTNYHSVVSVPVLSADTLLGNFSATGNYPIGGALSSCSGVSNALTYNTSTHAFGCNSISGSGTVNTGTAGHGAYYATSTTAVSDAGAANVSFGEVAVTSSGSISGLNGIALHNTNDLGLYGGGTLAVEVTNSLTQFDLPIIDSTSSGYEMTHGTPTASAPNFLPFRSATTTGFGAQGSGNADVVAAATEIQRWTSTGPLIVTIPTDATETDNTLCLNTTSHIEYTGTGTLGICLGTSSMASAKRDIAPVADGLDAIMALKPVNYFYRPGFGDNGAREQYGFIAEDYAKVLPKLTRFDSAGRPNGTDFLGAVPVLVKAVQEEQKEIVSISNTGEQAQITSLQRQIYFLWGVIGILALGFGYLYSRGA